MFVWRGKGGSRQTRVLQAQAELWVGHDLFCHLMDGGIRAG